MLHELLLNYKGKLKPNIQEHKWVTFNPYENGSYKNEANKVRKDGYQLQ